jgi:hypothetical protein
MASCSLLRGYKGSDAYTLELIKKCNSGKKLGRHEKAWLKHQRDAQKGLGGESGTLSPETKSKDLAKKVKKLNRKTDQFLKASRNSSLLHPTRT